MHSTTNKKKNFKMKNSTKFEHGFKVYKIDDDSCRNLYLSGSNLRYKTTESSLKHDRKDFSTELSPKNVLKKNKRKRIGHFEKTEIKRSDNNSSSLNPEEENRGSLSIKFEKYKKLVSGWHQTPYRNTDQINIKFKSKYGKQNSGENFFICKEKNENISKSEERFKRKYYNDAFEVIASQPSYNNHKGRKVFKSQRKDNCCVGNKNKDDIGKMQDHQYYIGKNSKMQKISYLDGTLNLNMNKLKEHSGDVFKVKQSKHYTGKILKNEYEEISENVDSQLIESGQKERKNLKTRRQRVKKNTIFHKDINGKVKIQNSKHKALIKNNLECSLSTPRIKGYACRHNVNKISTKNKVKNQQNCVSDDIEVQQISNIKEIQGFSKNKPEKYSKDFSRDKVLEQINNKTLKRDYNILEKDIYSQPIEIQKYKTNNNSADSKIYFHKTINGVVKSQKEHQSYVADDNEVYEIANFNEIQDLNKYKLEVCSTDTTRGERPELDWEKLKPIIKKAKQKSTVTEVQSSEGFIKERVSKHLYELVDQPQRNENLERFKFKGSNIKKAILEQDELFLGSKERETNALGFKDENLVKKRFLNSYAVDGNYQQCYANNDKEILKTKELSSDSEKFNIDELDHENDLKKSVTAEITSECSGAKITRKKENDSSLISLRTFYPECTNNALNSNSYQTKSVIPSTFKEQSNEGVIKEPKLPKDVHLSSQAIDRIEKSSESNSLSDSIFLKPNIEESNNRIVDFNLPVKNDGAYFSERFHLDSKCVQPPYNSNKYFLSINKQIHIFKDVGRNLAFAIFTFDIPDNKSEVTIQIEDVFNSSQLVSHTDYTLKMVDGISLKFAINSKDSSELKENIDLDFSFEEEYSKSKVRVGPSTKSDVIKRHINRKLSPSKIDNKQFCSDSNLEMISSIIPLNNEKCTNLKTKNFKHDDEDLLYGNAAQNYMEHSSINHINGCDITSVSSGKCKQAKSETFQKHNENRIHDFCDSFDRNDFKDKYDYYSYVSSLVTENTLESLYKGYVKNSELQCQGFSSTEEGIGGCQRNSQLQTPICKEIKVSSSINYDNIKNSPSSILKQGTKGEQQKIYKYLKSTNSNAKGKVSNAMSSGSLISNNSSSKLNDADLKMVDLCEDSLPPMLNHFSQIVSEYKGETPPVLSKF